MRTSNHQMDGKGCSWRQTFTDAAERMQWDHVFATGLFSNSSYPVWGRNIRQWPGPTSPGGSAAYCVVMQDVQRSTALPSRAAAAPVASDGTVIPGASHGGGAHQGEAGVAARGGSSHTLPGGESLQLTGYPGTGKMHLVRKIVEALAGARGHRAHHHEDRPGARAGWVQRWSGMLAVAAMRAYAAFLLELPPAGEACVAGEAPELHEILADVRGSLSLTISRLPAPTSHAA